MKDHNALDTHFRQTHELRMFFCPVRDCHQRFSTEEEAQNHVDIQNPTLDDYSL